MKIVKGLGLFDEQTVSEVGKKIAFDRLAASYSNVIHDMDAVADILFERA